jgi:hypothetical protein
MTSRNGDKGKRPKRRKDLDYCDEHQPLPASHHEEETMRVVEATCNTFIGGWPTFPIVQRDPSK